MCTYYSLGFGDMKVDPVGGQTQPWGSFLMLAPPLNRTMYLHRCVCPIFQNGMYHLSYGPDQLLPKVTSAAIIDLCEDKKSFFRELWG